MPVSPLAWRTGDELFCCQAVTLLRWSGHHPFLPLVQPLISLCCGYILAAPHRDAYSPWGINSPNFHSQGQAGKKKPHPVWVRCNSACEMSSGLVVTSSCEVISWADSSCMSRGYEYAKRWPCPSSLSQTLQAHEVSGNKYKIRLCLFRNTCK